MLILTRARAEDTEKLRLCLNMLQVKSASLKNSSGLVIIDPEADYHLP